MMCLSNHAMVGFMEGFAPNLARLKVIPIEGKLNTLKVFFDDGDEIEQREDVLKVTDAYLGLLLNCGVIGALVITLLFGSTTASQEFSSESIDYFTEEGCRTMFHFFNFFVTLGFYMSCLIVVYSIFKYKQLSFFMSTIELKAAYIERFSLVGLIVLSTGLLPG